jgi:hypothetical protein
MIFQSKNCISKLGHEFANVFNGLSETADKTFSSALVLEKQISVPYRKNNMLQIVTDWILR